MKRSLVASVLIAMLCLGGSGVANAQPTAQDQAVAEGLFKDAKKLMAEGNFKEACPKLEESQHLDPAPGTQFNLGECYEQVGKTASAWASFLNVAAAAKSAGMADREKIARDRAAALEPKLVKLTITVASPDTEVKRDGVVVGKALWGTAAAVDPGTHTITASAPGKEPWTKSIEVGAESVSVEVPALADAPKIATAAPEPIPVPVIEKRGWGTQKTLAVVAAGVGVVGVGVGSVFGLQGMSKLGDSEDHCTGNLCNAQGVALREDAVSAGNLSTVFFTVGLVALAGAAVLWITAPSTSASSGTARAWTHALGGSF